MTNKKNSIEKEFQFLDIPLPKSLPDPIKEIVNSFCYMVQTKQENDHDGMYQNCVRYIEVALPAFTNLLTQDVWKKLVNLNPQNINGSIPHFTVEMRAQKIAQVLLHMENNIEFVFTEIERCKRLIKKRKKVLGKLQDLIQSKRSYLLSAFRGYSHVDADPFLSSLIEEEKKEDQNIQRLEKRLGDIRKFQTEFMPVTRQSKGTGKATLIANFLHVVFMRLYGKPMHQYVAIFVNAIYGTSYKREEIASMVQRSKKIAKEHENHRFSSLQNVFEAFLRSFIARRSLGLWVTNPIK